MHMYTCTNGVHIVQCACVHARVRMCMFHLAVFAIFCLIHISRFTDESDDPRDVARIFRDVADEGDNPRDVARIRDERRTRFKRERRGVSLRGSGLSVLPPACKLALCSFSMLLEALAPRALASIARLTLRWPSPPSKGIASCKYRPSSINLGGGQEEVAELAACPRTGSFS
eukprot:1459272-Prymnesium_polylepis.1